MRRIESQRDQWPFRVLRYAAPESGTTTPPPSPSVTGTDNWSGLEVGTAFGVGSAREKAVDDVARAAAGTPYDYGGSGRGTTDYYGKPATGWDCTGLAADEFKAYTGQDPTGPELKDSKGERFNTTSDMAAQGFERGYAPGQFNIGLNPSEGKGGHVAIELPNGQHSESSGRDGAEYGPSARGVFDKPFTEQWHLPDATQTVVNQMNQMNSPSDAGSTQALTNKTSLRRRAVPEHPSRKYLDDLMKHIEGNDWGGMTIKEVPGDGPTSGYMVSLHGREEKIPLDDLSGQHLLDYLHKHHDDINSDPENYLGGWRDGQNWYSDVSHRHPRDKGLFPAARDAFQNQQLALYDIDNDRGIGTDEAGWMTGAPWIVGRRT